MLLFSDKEKMFNGFNKKKNEGRERGSPLDLSRMIIRGKNEFPGYSSAYLSRDHLSNECLL
jgi:hypothetical protein